LIAASVIVETASVPVFAVVVKVSTTVVHNVVLEVEEKLLNPPAVVCGVTPPHVLAWVVVDSTPNLDVVLSVGGTNEVVCMFVNVTNTTVGSEDTVDVTMVVWLLVITDDRMPLNPAVNVPHIALASDVVANTSETACQPVAVLFVSKRSTSLPCGMLTPTTACPLDKDMFPVTPVMVDRVCVTPA
jgi:hypothetical protein